MPAEATCTFDAATGTLTCSGGTVVAFGWVDVVKNALFETDNGKAKAEVKKVVAERGITSIGEYAFSECKSLTEAVLPDTLTSIGPNAFNRTALTSIVIPESVTELGESAFSGCENLASASLTEWESGWYYPIDGLTDVTILCEATMDNVESLVYNLLYQPVTIHAPAGSVVEGYINRQIQTNKDVKCTFAPIK